MRVWLVFFSIEKAMQAICSDWTKDKLTEMAALPQGSLASLAVSVCCYWVFFPIYPSQHLALQHCSTPIQSGTYGSKRPFREKRAQKEKNKILSYLSVPCQATLILYSLGETSGSCILVSNSAQ